MAEVDADDIGGQIETLVKRTIDRNIKGLEYLRLPAPAIGLTPKELVHEQGTLKLYHYRPMADEIYRVPLLLVMATTNRGSIFDIAPGQSLVEFLLKAGYDVYMMDWEAPLPHERTLNLADYTLGFIPDSIARIQARSGEPDVTLIGYCMGGVLSVIYQAMHAGGPVKNLITFTTPTDWHKMGMFNRFTDRAHFDVDHLVDTIGNVPSEMIFQGFNMRTPASRVAANARLYDNLWNEAFVESYRKVDRWALDMLPLAGEYFRDQIKQLMWGNGMMTGELTVDGHAADPRSITIPFLHAVAQHDDLVPYDASHPLIELVGSEDKTEIVLKGGHVSLVAGPNAVRRLWPTLDEWLQERSL
jgi:polyhydroxyalkanoate synthase